MSGQSGCNLFISAENKNHGMLSLLEVSRWGADADDTDDSYVKRDDGLVT